MSLQKEVEKKMQTSIDHLKEELSHLRTGRADPALLNNVLVEAYGSQMRLKDVATISAPEARQLLVTPFDSNNAGVIRKGIEQANLGLQVILDGNVIRVNVPAMDEAMRKEMVKQAKRKGEEAKVSIRNARREGNESLKKQKNDGEIAEDQQKKGETIIQKLTDDFCKKVDEVIEQKESDIMLI